MNIFVTRMRALLDDENGATAIEYVIVASVVGLAIIPVFSSTTNGVAGLLQRVTGYFDAIK